MKFSNKPNRGFDERYNIRLATVSDIDSIMQFISEHWKKNHILAHDKIFFNYEFCFNDNVNFVLAIDRKTNEIESLSGFINPSNPTTTPIERYDVWPSIWKTNDTHHNYPLIGLEVLNRISLLTGCRMWCGNSANPNTTVPLMRLMRRKTAKMIHFYRLNPYISDFKIAVINARPTESVSSVYRTKIIELSSMDEVRSVFNVAIPDVYPFKDEWYFEKRYFHHPYYKYKIYGLKTNSGKIGAIMVARECSANGANILRLVDYIGDHKLFAGLYDAIGKMFEENGYEFIDFLAFGFDESSAFAAGFAARVDDCQNIIPSYFEPFVQQNVDNYVNYEYENTLSFRADCDQDRPALPRNVSGGTIYE